MLTWRIDPGRPAQQTETADTAAVPLKWAHDARTGEPRYIHDVEVVQGCTCVCPACQLSLTPVMAGQPLRTRPTAHFRHPVGAQKDNCSLVAARLAATRHLQEIGFIELPRRRISRTAEGFSGEGYEVWVEAPAERVAVLGAALHDHATAILTLDDGRELFVDLTGIREPGNDGQGRAIVSLALSDQSIAMLGPEEIRARLRILPDIRWCSHWNDLALATEGDAAARQASQEALDGWQDIDEAEFLSHAPSGADAATMRRWRRETLLHREIKSILERASSIAIPGLEVEATRAPPDEFGGDWEQYPIRKYWIAPTRTLKLADVQLEQKLGNIVPDVIANLETGQAYSHGGTSTYVDGDFEEDVIDAYRSSWPSTMLIEVTVTHGIDEEKLRRVQELDLPMLEIDVSSLGGKVTLEGLRTLVVGETIGKRWVHHPIRRAKRRILEAEIDRHPVTIRYQERLAELRRPRLLATPVTEWGKVYLESLTAFYDANTRIKKIRRIHKGPTPKPPLLGKDSDLWIKITEAGEALAVHGFPGAIDTIMVEEAGIISRLLSIRHNRGIGYDFNTGFQVLNAIMQSGPETREWETLYPLAVKVYGLKASFSAKQADIYAKWRKSIVDKVSGGDTTILRPARYDAVLGVLFPELDPGLKTGYGRAKGNQ